VVWTLYSVRAMRKTQKGAGLQLKSENVRILHDDWLSRVTGGTAPYCERTATTFPCCKAAESTSTWADTNCSC
jgi:hypothetical protein